jgi:hypothetical protein
MLEVKTDESPSRVRFTTADSRSTVRRVISLMIVVGICVLGSACDESETTWSAEARSPDGRWLATATSRSEGGGPTAYDYTIVELKPLTGSQPATRVLGFSHQYPTMTLKMEWLSPKHLNVTYGTNPKPGDRVSLDSQVATFSGIEISARDLSTEPVKTLH